MAMRYMGLRPVSHGSSYSAQGGVNQIYAPAYRSVMSGPIRFGKNVVAPAIGSLLAGGATGMSWKDIWTKAKSGVGSGIEGGINKGLAGLISNKISPNSQYSSAGDSALNADVYRAAQAQAADQAAVFRSDQMDDQYNELYRRRQMMEERIEEYRAMKEIDLAYSQQLYNLTSPPPRSLQSDTSSVYSYFYPYGSYFGIPLPGPR